MTGRAAAPVGIVALSLLVAGLTACTGGGTSAPAAPATTAPTSLSAFPTAVPVLPGRVLARSRADGEWHLWIAAPDPLRGYRTAQALLVRAGFVITKDRQGTGGADGQLCTERLCVGLSGLDDPTYGKSVAYEVFHPLGTG